MEYEKRRALANSEIRKLQAMLPYLPSHERIDIDEAIADWDFWAQTGYERKSYES